MSTAMISNSENLKLKNRWRSLGTMSGVALLAVTAAACGSSSTSASTTTVASAGSTTSSAATTSAPVTVHLGYFPNITHGLALVGVNEGIFAKDLAPDTLNASQTFSAGPAENQALLSGSLDIAFIGPSSALSAYVASHGAIEIIAGAASAGAALVVKSSITSPAQLKGTTLASPQLANTQDVSLKYWLKTEGLSSSVTVQPSTTGNGTIVTEFKSGAIAGAWVPEPYVAEMVADGGHVLVNEKTLWPGGQFSTTEVVARTAFVNAHPATVQRFLEGLDDTLSVVNNDPSGAQTAANAQLTKLSTKPLPAATLSSAWSDLSFTLDPLESTVQTQADHAVALGLLKSPGSISGLFNLTILNDVLAAKGQPAISS
jgi:NitT/TauT family transport system substrate-binding protein